MTVKQVYTKHDGSDYMVTRQNLMCPKCGKYPMMFGWRMCSICFGKEIRSAESDEMGRYNVERKRHHYSEEDDICIKTRVDVMSYKEIGKACGFTESQIGGAVRRLRSTGDVPYDDKDNVDLKDYIRSHYLEMSDEKISILFNVAKGSVSKLRRGMGLDKSPQNRFNVTDADREYVKKYWKDLSDRQMAKNLKLTPSIIQGIRYGYDLIKDRRANAVFSLEDEQYIKENYKEKFLEEISKDLNVTLKQLVDKCYGLDIKKDCMIDHENLKREREGKEIIIPDKEKFIKATIPVEKYKINEIRTGKWNKDETNVLIHGFKRLSNMQLATALQRDILDVENMIEVIGLERSPQTNNLMEKKETRSKIFPYKVIDFIVNYYRFIPVSEISDMIEIKKDILQGFLSYLKLNKFALTKPKEEFVNYRDIDVGDIVFKTDAPGDSLKYLINTYRIKTGHLVTLEGNKSKDKERIELIDDVIKNEDGDSKMEKEKRDDLVDSRYTPTGEERIIVDKENKVIVKRIVCERLVSDKEFTDYVLNGGEYGVDE